MTRQNTVEQRLPRPDNLTLPGNQSSLPDSTPSDEGVAGWSLRGSFLLVVWILWRPSFYNSLAFYDLWGSGQEGVRDQWRLNLFQ